MQREFPVADVRFGLSHLFVPCFPSCAFGFALRALRLSERLPAEEAIDSCENRHTKDSRPRLRLYMRLMPAVFSGAAILVLGIGIAAAAPTRRTVQIDLSRARGVQTESSIAVDPETPRVLVAASQDASVCGIRVYASGDGGKEWTSTPLPVADPSATRKAIGGSKFCAFNQWVGAGRDGRQYVVFGQNGSFQTGYGIYLSSRLYPQAWSSPRPVDPTLAGTSGFDDKPVVAVDNTSGAPYAGRVYVAWTRWTVAGVEGHVLLAHSDDGGQTWSQPNTIPPAQGANWGIHLAVASDGTLYAAAWNGSGPGDLWITRSTDGGATFQPPRVYASRVGSPSSGSSYVPAEPTQPVHSDASLAVDTSNGDRAGTVYTAYSRATRSGRRIVVNSFNRDLAPGLRHTIAARQTRGAYDEFNPTIAVDGSNGIVWACFYLTGTGKQRTLATYSCVDSRNGGRTWSRVIGGASVPSNETARGAFNRAHFIDNDYASYEGLAVIAGIAHPIWTDTRGLKRLKEEIYTTVLRAPR